MLTKTAIRHPKFAARIRAAAVMAVRASWRPGQRVGRVAVHNAAGRLALLVVHHRGQGLEFIDARDNDVTSTVLAGLQSAPVIRSRPPVYPVTAASFADWASAVLVHAFHRAAVAAPIRQAVEV